MTEQEMRNALSNQLSIFRNWGYEKLAQHVEQGPFWKPQDSLEYVEAVATDGTPFQMEFNVYWNDKAGEAIRVIGSLSAEPQKRLWGFLPIYSSDMTDSFEISPKQVSEIEGDSETAQQDGDLKPNPAAS